MIKKKEKKNRKKYEKKEKEKKGEKKGSFSIPAEPGFYPFLSPNYEPAEPGLGQILSSSRT